MRRWIAATAFVLFALSAAVPAKAQLGMGGGGGGMGGGGMGGGMGGMGGGMMGGMGGGGGGVFIDPQGVLRAAELKGKAARSIQPKLNEELAARTDLRQISLRQLDRELRAAKQSGKPLPEEIWRLAGMTKIDYLILDRENQDILLAGPAEGWRVEADGRALGLSSNRPILNLDDLVTSLRNVLSGPAAVSCSIDPTAKGLAALRANQLEKVRTDAQADSARKTVLDLCGMQIVSTTGVTKGSRFALVMIEADYRMKRMAIGLEKVPGLFTHLDAVAELTESGNLKPNLARWWFTPSYDAVVRNPEGTVFKLRGQGVKLLNEEQFVDEQGNRTGSGRSNVQWDKFSQDFTKKFSKLSDQYPCFADLKNLFDLMIVAGVVKKEGAGEWLSDTALLREDLYKPFTLNQPAEAEPVVATRLATKRADGKRYTYFTFAFGGVSIRPNDILKADKLVTESGSDFDSVPTKLVIKSNTKASKDLKFLAAQWWANVKN